MTREPLLFTVSEAAEVLDTLDGARPSVAVLSPRMICYWDRPGGVQPSKVEGGARPGDLSKRNARDAF